MPNLLGASDTLARGGTRVEPHVAVQADYWGEVRGAATGINAVKSVEAVCDALVVV